MGTYIKCISAGFSSSAREPLNGMANIWVRIDATLAITYMQPSAGKSTDRRWELLFLRWYECTAFSAPDEQQEIKKFRDHHATFLQIDTKGESLFTFLVSSLISLLSRLCQLSWRYRATFFPTVNAVKWYWWHAKAYVYVVQQLMHSVRGECLCVIFTCCEWHFCECRSQSGHTEESSWLASLFVLFTCGERGNQVWWMHFTHIKLLCHISTLSTSANVFFMKPERWLVAW